MNRHTPGPWTATADQRSNIVVDVSGQEIAIVINKKAEADASLIAAAPELLEAAKLVIAWYESEDDHSKADFYQRLQMCRDSEAACRAAIAKATGEPQ